jgi:putative membrane protein
MDQLAYVPYCGAPPVPGGEHWNLDPNLLIILGAIALLYGFEARRRRIARLQFYAFAAGWLVLLLALVSPLCNLSVALFSARITQHMMIVLVAAPLLVAGGVDLMLRQLWTSADDTPGTGTVFTATGLFAAALWIWHLPGPYDTTFRSDFIYWSMHVTMIAAALALWHVLLRAGLGHLLIASVATGIQMSGIGAILALAPQPLYEAHLDTTLPWGLTPLQDQSLGGLIMWVPGGLALSLIVLATLAHHLQRLDVADAVHRSVSR